MNDKAKSILLFPGQGAQFVGMGKDLYDSDADIRELYTQANETLGYDITKICFEGPESELNITSNSQPALLLTSLAAVRAIEKKTGTGLGEYFNIAGVAGLSLGEYSALTVAEAFDMRDALRLTHQRGTFMKEASEKNPGGMASILKLDREKVIDICERVDGYVVPTNFNCPGQIVISGDKEAVETAAALAKEEGGRAIVLKVSGAFHSNFMTSAAEKLAEVLEKIEMSAPKYTFVSNVAAKPLSKTDEIKKSLVKQVSSAIMWEDCMRFYLEKGITRFYEIGPGKVLAGLMKRIDNNAEVVNLGTREEIAEL